ncbi:MAG: ABC transporter substrate-binding protein [Proteobacteria bacterium]|nr:ABC transporter substrate-binding protein [Pseudomonadota bacterium]
MKSLIKRWLIVSILFVLTTVLTTIPAFVTAGEKEEVPSWDWKGKEPIWWKWGKEYWPTKPVRGGTLRVARPNYIGLMNPNHWPVYDWGTMELIHEKFIYPDEKLRPNVPWLAKSWEFTDPTTVLMKLRKGVEFTDGSSFNARAVKYQMDWIKDKSNGAFTRAWLAEINSTDVVDEYTVRFNLRSSWAGFAGNMSYAPGFVMSAKALKADKALITVEKLEKRLKRLRAKAEKTEKAAAASGATKKEKRKAKKARAKVDAMAAKLAPLKQIARNAKKYDTNPVGSGRYMVDEAKPGNYLKLKRNPNWWFGQSIGKPDMPYFEYYLVTVIPDESIRLANFRAGKLHTLWISGSSYKMVENNKNIAISKWPGHSWYGLTFNTAKGPAKDIRIRKAIAHAIDRKALIHGVLFGLGFEASGPYPGFHWCHNPNLKPRDYDPELSKKLLAEAGYANGLTLKGHVTGTTTGIAAMTEAMQAMLGKVGVKWDVTFLDLAAATDRLNNLEYEMRDGAYTYIQEPDLMATAYYHSDGNWNRGRYVNPRIDELVLKGRVETDMERRSKIYWEIEKILYDDYADVFAYWPIWVNIKQKVMAGYNYDLHVAGNKGYEMTHPNWFVDGRGNVAR